MEDGRHRFLVGEAGLTGELAGVEGPVGTQEVRWGLWLHKYQSGVQRPGPGKEMCVDLGIGREGSTGTSEVPARPCRVKCRS